MSPFQAGKRIVCALPLLLGLLFLAGSPTPGPAPGPLPAIDGVSSVGVGTAPHNCRFWAGVSEQFPDGLLAEQLIDLPRSLARLSLYNRHGWAVAGIPAAGETVLRRGEAAAHLDRRYELAVAEADGAAPRVAVAHIRFCSSGLCDIPNPHPFERVKDGRRWLMGHNGTIDKEILLALIRPEYLAANPPQIGSGPDEWIDSELYFLFILQSCEKRYWDVEPALGEVIRELREAIPADHEQLNFVLSDGVMVWAYREGLSLYYLDRLDTERPWSAVASQYPSEAQGDWVTLADGQLVTLSADAAPVVVDIETHFEATALPDPADVAAAPVLLPNFPNPFNPSTRIRFELPVAGRARLGVYDIGGRRVAGLLDETLAAGPREATWDGRDQTGRPVPAGVYLARL